MNQEDMGLHLYKVHGTYVFSLFTSLVSISTELPQNRTKVGKYTLNWSYISNSQHKTLKGLMNSLPSGQPPNLADNVTTKERICTDRSYHDLQTLDDY